MQIITVLIIFCWVIFGIVWLVGSFYQKQAAEKPSNMTSLIVRFLFGIPFMILIRPEWFFSSIIIVNDSLFANITSSVFCISGLGICIWARKTLAGNWSEDIDFKKAHELVQSGPYRFVRHPIYTGFLLMFLGSALVVGKLGGFIGFVILFTGCLIRIIQEELLLTKHFKEKYISYKKRVKSLIPYVV